MQEKITARVILFNNAGKILLIKRSPTDDKPNLWDLPGGKMEEEDRGHKKPKKACAKRELYEETGINIKTHRLKKRGEVLHPLKNKLFCLFSAAVRGKPQIVLSEEHTESMWCNPSNLPKDMNPSTATLIANSHTLCNKLAA